MAHPIHLAAERSEREARNADALRDELFEKCRSAVADLGDEISGFALVAWGKDGAMRTAYNAAQGPIGPALLPTLAADALNRHVAVMIARSGGG